MGNDTSAVKSREEILNKENGKPDEMGVNWVTVSKSAAIQAMGEYAKQEAIGFAIRVLDKFCESHYQSEENISDEYDYYIESKNKK